jgi:NADPH-dependent 2,4-dienoyl-CoA reductase/sulfur reductase-like enzyme
MARIVVIGAVAAGTSAASQAKRRQPEAEVILLERGPYVSYGACGIPYNLQDPTRSLDDLVAVSAERFRTERRVDVRMRHEVTAIEPGAKRVRVRDLDGGRDYSLDYDVLIVATGAKATPLTMPGADLPGVTVLRELTDAERLKKQLDEAAPRSAVLVGAGYIGMELAETLRRRGLEVTVLEKGPDVLAGFAPELVALAREELGRQRVRVEVGIELRAIERAGQGLVARTDRGDFPADLIVISVGVKPNVQLAEAAGVRLGRSGAIAVDDQQRTNLPDVLAAGDCAEAKHLVSGVPVWVPLGTTANKQGKIAGANAVGAHERFAGIVGSAVFKLFDLQVARTGLGPAELERLPLDALTSVSTQFSRAKSAGGGEPIQTVLYVERGSGRLLGAQMAGRDGVAQRIDVFAAALHAGMTVEQVEDLDLAYAPPFAPVYDPILIAATVARKDLQKAGARKAAP